MIVHELDVIRVAASPNETNPPSIVDTNAMLTLTIAFQSFQAIARRDQKVL
jgi:hypothetical protein